MNAKLQINGKTIEANPALTEVLETAFLPNSASANVAGQSRAEVAKFFLQNLPALGKVEMITLEDESEVVTVDAIKLPDVLQAIVSGCEKNEAYRASVQVENNLYNQFRVSYSKIEKDGEKRGRKSQTVEQKFAQAFNIGGNYADDVNKILDIIGVPAK